MLFQNVIEPAQTRWAAPILFAQMRDKSLCFSINYKKLNNLLPCDVYPIRRIDECIDSFDKATIILTHHANSGYRQVEIEDEDPGRITFTSHLGLHRFVRIPFGLKTHQDCSSGKWTYSSTGKMANRFGLSLWQYHVLKEGQIAHWPRKASANTTVTCKAHTQTEKCIF